MSAEASSYDAGEYRPPHILTVVSKILNFPRQEYSSDIANYIASGYSNKTNNYRAGLIFLACIIGGIAFMWGFIIMVLKCKGKAVGCAAGHAFERKRQQRQQQTAKAESTDLEEDISESVAHIEGSSQERVSGDDNKQQTTTTATATTGGNNIREVESFSIHSSLPSADLDCSSIETGSSMSMEEYSVGGTESNGQNDDEEDEALLRPSARERRTQMVFFLFGLITLACVPLVLIFAFAPLKASTEQADVHLRDARDLLDRLQSSLDTVATATNDSVTIVDSTLGDIDSLCPPLTSMAEDGTTNETKESVLGFDLVNVVVEFQASYESLEADATGNISEVITILSEVDDAVAIVDISYEQVENYIWLVPAILLVLGFLAGFTMFGVFLAWRQDSNLRFQRILSYGVLPLFVAVSLACWVIAIAAGVSVAIGSDTCTYGGHRGDGSFTGSPDEMINALLAEKLKTDREMYAFVQSYTNGCQDIGNSTNSMVLSALEDRIDGVVDYIWNYLSLIDTAGRDELADFCGTDNLNRFFAGSRELAKLLMSIRRALGSIRAALSCQRINPIYVEIVHNSVCTDVASATSWAFILFFVVGVSTMCMITLRAAWRHKIPEDKIFELEDEAENMIVDEHEEYLEYISKYKHEWQEYEGLDTQLPRTGRQVMHNGREEPIVYESASDSELSSQNQDGLDTSTCTDPKPVILEAGVQQELFDPYNSASDTDARSQSTGDISFPSLLDPDEAKPQKLLRVAPPPLLSLDPSELDDEEFDAAEITPGLLNVGKRKRNTRDLRVKTEREPAESPDVPTDLIIEYQGSLEATSKPKKSPRKSFTQRLVENLSPTSFGSRLTFGSSSSSSDNIAEQHLLSFQDAARMDVGLIECDLDGDLMRRETSSEEPSFGSPVILESPSSFRSPSKPKSPGFVKFHVDNEETPSSRVKQQADFFVKKSQRVSRPPTPTRQRTPEMKVKAAKFDYPSSS